MSHEIEQYDNGEYGFVGNRAPGWHMLGTTWTPGDQTRLTAAEAMKIAHLTGWDVRLSSDMIVLDPKTGDPINVTGWAVTLRNNPVDPDAPAQPLGLVSESYVPVQNEEAFAFAQALIDDEGLEVETAGSIKGGRQTFMLFRLPRTIEFGGDKVYPYLHAATGHDGSLAVNLGLTGVRVQCANTQAMALAEVAPRYRIQHRGDDVMAQLEDAKKALAGAEEQLDRFAAQMKRWTDTPITPTQFDRIVMRKFPAPSDPADDSPAAKVLRDANRESLRLLYEAADTNGNITGTAWGAAQAMLEWQDWMRGRNTGKNRARSQVSAQAEEMRRQAFAIVAREVPSLA